MRIAIVGVGGVGGLVAGLLARAGTEVAVLARNASLAAIRQDGLAVDSPLGTFTVRPAAVSDDPAALGVADVVLVAVKAWQVGELAPKLAPLLAPGGFAVPLQNGVEAAERLAAALGPERVAGGLSFLLAWTEAPGRVKHVGGPPKITMGEVGGGSSARLEHLAATLNAAGVVAELADDISAALWRKFLFIDPLGTVGAATRAPVGVIRSVPETRALLAGAMREVAAVAKGRGVDVGAQAVDAALKQVDSMPAEATASMHRDLAAGRASELEDQTGAVVRLGRAAAVPTPIHDALFAALLPMERAARGAVPKFART
jgi:2-dehydropantoate 2-reductase